jgi:hypothetical protein
MFAFPHLSLPIYSKIILSKNWQVVAGGAAVSKSIVHFLLPHLCKGRAGVGLKIHDSNEHLPI